MPIYAATIPGMKPVYIRAPSAAKALAELVEVKALKSEEILDVFDGGAKTFKAGDKIEPADPPEKGADESKDELKGEPNKTPPSGASAPGTGEKGKA